MHNIQSTTDYNSFLVEIKEQIQSSQIRAIKSVNQEMIMLYFGIGQSIYQKQQELGWGAKVIDNLSRDIKSEFPELGGFSARNIKRMLRFYKEYSQAFEKVPQAVAQIEDTIMPPLVAQIPWSHNIILIEKIKDRELQYWYIQKILEKHTIVAEYSLKNMSQPIRISEYELTEVLPKEFESSLPTIEMIENELLNTLDTKGKK